MDRHSVFWTVAAVYLYLQTCIVFAVFGWAAAGVAQEIRQTALQKVLKQNADYGKSEYPIILPTEADEQWLTSKCE